MLEELPISIVYFTFPRYRQKLRSPIVWGMIKSIILVTLLALGTTICFDVIGRIEGDLNNAQLTPFFSSLDGHFFPTVTAPQGPCCKGVIIWLQTSALRDPSVRVKYASGAKGIGVGERIENCTIIATP